MKAFILIFILAISCVSGDGMQSCILNEDCATGECCISMVFVRGFCHTLGQEGDHCITKPADTKHGIRNIFGCPCIEGLECVPEIIEEEEGKIIMKNMTCKKA